MSENTFVNRQFYQQLKKRAVCAILLVVIIALPTFWFAGYYAGRAQGGSTPVFEHPAGSYNYLIWKEGSTYYAKNGETGAIDYSGTNATQVIQNAIDALSTDGGLVFLKEGKYTLTGTIVIEKNGTTLRGSTWEATILTYSGNAEAIRIGWTTGETYDNEISNIRLNLSNTDAIGIRLTNTFRWRLHKIRVQPDDSISNPQTTGIKLEDGGNWVGQGLISLGNFRKNKVGINITGTNSEISIMNTRIRSVSKTYSGSYGIIAQGGSVTGGDTLTLHKVQFSFVETAIYLKSSPTSQWLTWVAQSRFEQITTGVRVETARNTFYQCSFASTVTTPVNSTGNYNRFYDCYNFNTISFGERTVADGEWIAHTLVDTPSTVLVTVGTPRYGGETVVVGVWQSTINSTHFEVEVRWVNGTAITDDVIKVYWYAEYAP